LFLSYVSFFFSSVFHSLQERAQEIGAAMGAVQRRCGDCRISEGATSRQRDAVPEL
jgi:hypothetical protein